MANRSSECSRSSLPLVAVPALGAPRADVSDRQRSAQRTQAGPARRRHRREGHAPGLVLAEAGGVRHGARPDVHQLGSRVRRQLRLPGQLRRLHDLGREQPGQARQLVSVVSCITSQGDPSIYGNLLFISAEGGGNRNDCAKGGVQDPKDHMAGVRIYDVSEPEARRSWSRTCRRAKARTRTRSSRARPTRASSTSMSREARRARPEAELAGCKNGTDPADETNSLFRLDVIKVPLANPEQAEVVTGARIFTGLDAGAAERGSRGGRDASPRPARGLTRPGARTRHRRRQRARGTATTSRRIRRCTCSPARAAATACSSTSRIRKSRCASTPRSDTNFSLWHTAVFSNDGTKVVFTDEWGGGTSPNVPGEQHDGDGRQHDPHHRRRQEVHAARVLQDPDGAERAGELRVAQRRAHSGAGPRHHGAGLVSGRRRRDATSPIPIIRTRSRTSIAGRSIQPSRRLAGAGSRRGRRTRGRPHAWHDRRLVGRVLLERT